MIIIYTDRDIRKESRVQPIENIGLMDIDIDLMPPASWAEDVYVWRGSGVKALKRRNAPLVIPNWLKDRLGVDL